MAHFAKLNTDNKVIDVIVVNNSVLLDENNTEREELGVAFLVQWSNGYPYWKQTSYNGTFRKNFAGIGDTYDPIKDVFIPPKPYPSWILDENTYRWNPPTPIPDTIKLYRWDEPTTSWVEG